MLGSQPFVLSQTLRQHVPMVFSGPEIHQPRELRSHITFGLASQNHETYDHLDAGDPRSQISTQIPVVQGC
jgi:hypothetical protein